MFFTKKTTPSQTLIEKTFSCVKLEKTLLNADKILDLFNYNNLRDNIPILMNILNVPIPKFLKIIFLTDFNLEKGVRVKIDNKYEGEFEKIGFNNVVLKNNQRKSKLYIPVDIVEKSVVEIFFNK